MKRDRTVPPQLVLIFGILAVSTASVFIRNAQNYAPSLVIAAYRLTLATVILTPIAFTRQRKELGALGPREVGLALLSGLLLAIHFATWITSLEYTSVTSSVVLVTTTPLWVALLAPITVKEPLTRPVIVGLSLAMIGGITIGLSDMCSWQAGFICFRADEIIQQGAILGDLLALAGALAAAGYILIGRSLRQGMSLIGYIFIVYGIAALALVGFMLLAGDQAFGYPPQAYFWFILLAIIPQLLGHSSFNWALGYLSAAYVSISLLGEPIGSSILAFIFLHEIPGTIEIIGAILILTGIYLASRSQA